MAGLSPRMIILWFILPAVNFFTWYYVSHSTAPVIGRDCEEFYSQERSNRATSAVPTLLPALPCDNTDLEVESTFTEAGDEDRRHGVMGYRGCHPVMNPDFEQPNIEEVLTKDFDGYREARLAPMTELKGGQNGYTTLTSIIRPFGHNLDPENYPHDCTSFKVMNRDVQKCIAVVRPNNIGSGALNILRYDSDIDEHNLKISSYESTFGLKSKYYKKYKKPHEFLFTGNAHNFDVQNHIFTNQTLRPVGFFRKIPKERGHDRTKEKMGPFVRYFDGKDGIAAQLKDLLDKNDIKAGDDLTVMVVNQGEIDLYLNFACSCRLHNISMSNVIVFAGSSEIITIIESTGAIGIYHKGYSSVSKKASNDYLDRVFVDMMWFKAFSVYLILRLKINVLFQDADLVWFKDPFPYFHNYGKDNDGNVIIPGSEHIEAFFSDDGQRSLRYSPFYANSGFYYLKANSRTEYFAWSIMTSFDAVQVLGSHQNVLTMRLVEEFSLTAKYIKLLDLNAFPGGVMYHHDHAYMKRLRENKEHPYGFHMCWTQGKPDKLIYLKKSKMWYLKDTCSALESLTPEGDVFGSITERESHHTHLRWDHLSKLCCTMVKGAP